MSIDYYPPAANQPPPPRRRPVPIPVFKPWQAERFRSHVRQGEGCWTWTGSVSGNGRARYGNYTAARVAYALMHCVDPVNWQVCHTCDNPACVRPDHFFLGTQQDNMLDFALKGGIRDDFPLQFHEHSGQWRKKIKGKVVYFGSDRDTALERYREHCSERRAAGKGHASVTLRDTINAFLTAKKARVESGELAERTYLDYVAAAQRFRQHLDLDRPLASYGPDDFTDLRARLAERGEKIVNKRQKIVTGRGPVSLNNDLCRLRVMLKFAHDERLIEQPVWGGQALKPVAKRVLRKHRRTRVFTREEILALLERATPTLRAMTLLGINCGFGNDDVTAVQTGSVGTDGMITLPRNKTGTERRCYLWGESLSAIQAVSLPFTTPKGRAWSRKDRAVSKAFAKLMQRAGVERDGRNFYTLRHTFQTIADSAPFSKEHAVRYLMGHVDGTMSGNYREWISEEQLEYIAKFVHSWLYGHEAPTLT